MEIFVIEKGEYIELHDLLKVTGISSTGGEAKNYIAEGLVTVDGAVEQRKRCKIRPGQLVEYQGRKIQIQHVPSNEHLLTPQLKGKDHEEHREFPFRSGHAETHTEKRISVSRKRR